MSSAWLLLLPELRRVSPERRDAALVRARETPFDLLELAGAAAALLVVTALTRQLVDLSSMAARFGSLLVSFVAALPLLALSLAPLRLRRLRRGLRRQLESGGGS